MMKSEPTPAPKEVRSVLETYPAILRADKVEWTDGAPEQLRAGQEMRVHITLLDRVQSENGTEQGRRMAAALEKLAASSAAAAFDEPAEWQREARQERPLPGRDA
jgi:hypothetical protein